MTSLGRENIQMGFVDVCPILDVARHDHPHVRIEPPELLHQAPDGQWSVGMGGVGVVGRRRT